MKERKITPQQMKMLLGHLWEKNTGWCTGWSGWDGTFTCQRCLSVLKASRPNNSSPYEYEWMKNLQGKKVPKEEWHNCPCDKMSEAKQ